MQTYKRQRGFTFIEIIAALTLLSLLGALSIRPMKTYVRRLNFDSSVNGLKGLILTAKSRAIANPSVHCGVFFDVQADPQRILAFQDQTDPESYTYEAGKDKSYLQPYVLKTGIRIALVPDYPPSIIFRGDGSAYVSVKVIITDGTLTDTVDVLARTGRIKGKQ